MPWPTLLFGKSADKRAARAADAAAQKRAGEWEQALARNSLPPFVESRLHESRDGLTPWTSTMTAPELLLAVTRGVRPIATVSGTCWFQFERSWTDGHADGWRSALKRIKAEAVACGANAVVDVKMRTVHGDLSTSMDFSLIGTAVKIDRLDPSSDPIVATTPLLSFLRLMQAGVVPVGIAVGAKYDWLIDPTKSFSGNWSWNNQELSTLSRFWEGLRRVSHHELRGDTARQGNGVLAHTQLSQLFKMEMDKAPDRYLGRHIVIGTAVQAGEASPIPLDIEMVVDMNDETSPLAAREDSVATMYDSNEREGGL